jgi:protein-S-isoprenylcysteine O-methyltransferase Ste14
MERKKDGSFAAGTAARNAIGGFALLAFSLVPLFLPAWTFRYWQAWDFVLCGGAGASIQAYLQRADPKLLERRLRGPGAEKATSQKIVQGLAAILSLFAIALSSFDHRLAWSHVPFAATLAADAFVGAGFVIVFLALRENTFAAVNIDVEPGQTVVSTGPYALVRHPYYAGLLLIILASPPALGSWWGLLAFVPMTLVIAARIRFEERFLRDHLRGYVAYCRAVRYRLLPPIW